MKRTAGIVGIAAMITLISLSIFPGGPIGMTDGVGTPDTYFMIILEQSSYKVDVSPGSDGIVIVRGNVSVSSGWTEADSYTVNLLANANGWTTSTIDPIVLTENANSQYFEVRVEVPIETSSQTVGEVTISGRYTPVLGINSGMISPVSASLKVDQYYSLAFACDEDHVDVLAGNSLGYRCRIINTGNGDDRAVVEVKNLVHLNSLNITVQVSQDKFQIPEKQERILTLSVFVDNSTAGGNYTIELCIHSAKAESLGEDPVEVPLNLTVEVTSIDGEDLPYIGTGPLIAILILVSFLVLVVKRKDL